MSEPTKNRYRCNFCGRIYTRKSDKLWIKSYCEWAGRMARLYRVIPVKGEK